MSHSVLLVSLVPTAPSLHRGVRRALRLLLRSHDYAASLGTSAWDFAHRFARLQEVGCDELDLRWLLASGFVHVSLEAEAGKNGTSAQLPADPETASRQLRVILTEAGVALARPPQPHHGHARTDSLRPFWDSDLRELRLEAEVLKRYRQPSVNQVTVLTAFQEEDWRPRIDDPLPGKSGSSPKQRLHDTLRRLNDGLARIRFCCDGLGTGVCWHWVQAAKRQAGP